MKKIKKNHFFFFLFLLVFVSSNNLKALDITCLLDSDRYLVCTLNITPFRKQSIINSMEIGHRSEIEYRIRIYEKKSRMFGLLGDRIAGDYTYTYTATRDPLTETFYLICSEGSRTVIDNSALFFDTFFRMEDFRVFMGKERKGNYYVKGRITLKVIKLIPPLNLLSNIIPGVTDRTGWFDAGSFRIE